jgi:hypothetical protein
MNYSKHKVFKSNVKYSQSDFLHSSVLLELIWFLLRVLLPLLLLVTAWMNSVSLAYIVAEWTWTYSKHISRDSYPASILVRRSDLHITQLPLLLRVGPCLQSCCLATRWSNPLQLLTKHTRGPQPPICFLLCPQQRYIKLSSTPKRTTALYVCFLSGAQQKNNWNNSMHKWDTCPSVSSIGLMN